MSVTTEGPWGMPQQSRTEVQFSGRRGELFGRLLRGYLLMLPTLGNYPRACQWRERLNPLGYGSW